MKFEFEFDMFENYGLDTKRCPYRVHFQFPSKTTAFLHRNMLTIITKTSNIINHLTFFL